MLHVEDTPDTQDDDAMMSKKLNVSPSKEDLKNVIKDHKKKIKMLQQKVRRKETKINSLSPRWFKRKIFDRSKDCPEIEWKLFWSNDKYNWKPVEKPKQRSKGSTVLWWGQEVRPYFKFLFPSGVRVMYIRKIFSLPDDIISKLWACFFHECTPIFKGKKIKILRMLNVHCYVSICVL